MRTLRRRPPETTYLREVLRDSPAGYWPMDEPAGTTAVDRANGRDGTYTVGNGALAVGGPFNTRGGLLLGTTGSLVFPDAAAFSASAFTVEGWYRAPSGGFVTSDVLFNKVHNATASLREWWVNGETGLIVFYLYNTGTGHWKYWSFPYTGAQEWVHIVWTTDGTTTVGYLNGVPQSLTFTNGTGSRQGDTTCPPGFGHLAGLVSNGHADNVRGQHLAYYGSILSAERVRAHYDAMVRR